jgi:hypothetical protein
MSIYTPNDSGRFCICETVAQPCVLSSSGRCNRQKAGKPMALRWHVTMRSFHTLRREEHLRSLITWATAKLRAFFVKGFLKDMLGIDLPEELLLEPRRAVLRDARAGGLCSTKRSEAKLSVSYVICKAVVLLARPFQRVLRLLITSTWSMRHAEHYVTRITQLRSLPFG